MVLPFVWSWGWLNLKWNWVGIRLNVGRDKKENENCAQILDLFITIYLFRSYSSKLYRFVRFPMWKQEYNLLQLIQSWMVTLCYLLHFIYIVCVCFLSQSFKLIFDIPNLERLNSLYEVSPTPVKKRRGSSRIRTISSLIYSLLNSYISDCL